MLIGAGLAAGLVLGLGGGSAQQPVTPAPVPASQAAAAPETPAAAANHVAPAPKPAPAPAATPSSAIETLQRELGQLNYYEGPITGTMNSQTVAAITYLQRDAHLPQTGTMNAATQQALVTMLAQGNNQMGQLTEHPRPRRPAPLRTGAAHYDAGAAPVPTLIAENVTRAPSSGAAVSPAEGACW